MTPELQKYYENRFSMMATEGWKDLIEDVEKIRKTLNNIAVIENESQLQFNKGELSILDWLINLNEISSRAYEELNEKDV